MNTQESEIEPIGTTIESTEKDGILEIYVRSSTFLRDEAQYFQSLTRSATSRGITKFLVDFGECQYISSEGLGCVAEFWRECTEKENYLMVSTFSKKPDNQLLNFFEIIGLARVMRGFIFTDYKKARNFLLKK